MSGRVEWRCPTHGLVYAYAWDRGSPPHVVVGPRCWFVVRADGVYRSCGLALVEELIVEAPPEEDSGQPT